MDGLTNWVDLDTRTNNTSINQNTWFSGSCTATSSYRYLSILLTGPDSSGTNNLTFAEFEVYGDITVAGAEPIESTDDLPEGLANLYYTDSRVQSYITNTATVPGAALVDNSVTFAKLPQISQNQLLGRHTAGTGNIETITLGTGLSFTGSTLNVSVVGGVTSVVGQTGAVTATQVASGLNTLTGADRVDYTALKNLPTLTKTKNIESVSSTKTLILTDAYYQFLTPTVASVIVKLPLVSGSDYFECEIVNVGAGTNAIAVQENNGTAVVSLVNSNDKARSIYVYWDGSIWQVWIRGYF
jgi:hypothetical protein